MKRKLCGWPGCSALSDGYYCDKHKAIADARRAESTKQWNQRASRTKSAAYHSMYNTPEWKKKSKAFLFQHPFCVRCGAKAILVDHIIPHRGNGVLFWDESNWQSMCQSCHSIKTRQEKRVYG